MIGVFICLLCVLLISDHVNNVHAKPMPVYLVENCGGTIVFKDSLLLSLRQRENPRGISGRPYRIRCTVAFKTSGSIVFHWTHFNVGRTRMGAEWIQLLNGKYASISGKRWGFKNSTYEEYPTSSYQLPDYNARADRVVINYFGTPYKDNFTVVMTATSNPSLGKCPETYSRCRSRICVPDTVKCDGYINCPRMLLNSNMSLADRSDEYPCGGQNNYHITGHATDSNSYALISVAVLTVLVFLTLIIMIFYFCNKARRVRLIERHRRLHANYGRWHVRRPDDFMMFPPPYSPTPGEEEDALNRPPSYFDICNQANEAIELDKPDDGETGLATEEVQGATGSDGTASRDNITKTIPPPYCVSLPDDKAENPDSEDMKPKPRDSTDNTTVQSDSDAEPVTREASLQDGFRDC